MMVIFVSCSHTNRHWSSVILCQVLLQPYFSHSTIAQPLPYPQSPSMIQTYVVSTGADSMWDVMGRAVDTFGTTHTDFVEKFTHAYENTVRAACTNLGDLKPRACRFCLEVLT